MKKFALIICRSVACGIVGLTFLHLSADRLALHIPRLAVCDRMGNLPGEQRSGPRVPLPVHSESKRSRLLEVLLAWGAKPDTKRVRRDFSMLADL